MHSHICFVWHRKVLFLKSFMMPADVFCVICFTITEDEHVFMFPISSAALTIQINAHRTINWINWNHTCEQRKKKKDINCCDMWTSGISWKTIQELRSASYRGLLFER